MNKVLKAFLLALIVLENSSLEGWKGISAISIWVLETRVKNSQFEAKKGTCHTKPYNQKIVYHANRQTVLLLDH